MQNSRDHTRTGVMARVKVCPSCGHENVTSSPFCVREQCGFSLADVEIAEAGVSASELFRESRTPEKVIPTATTRESANTANIQVKATLKLPWGDVDVVETLFIGRDPDLSPLAMQLEQQGYGWVSRKHAELYTEDGVLYVRDVGSTHGTFVNGKRIETQPVALADGDRVSFSQRLVTTVRLG